MDTVGFLSLFFSFYEISGFFLLRLFKLTLVTLLCLQSYWTYSDIPFSASCFQA